MPAPCLGAIYMYCENKTQLCVKAAEKRIFKKAADFLDLRKTCVFYKTAAEKLRLFL